jgi:hypothetical protein
MTMTGRKEEKVRCTNCRVPTKRLWSADYKVEFETGESRNGVKRCRNTAVHSMQRLTLWKGEREASTESAVHTSSKLSTCNRESKYSQARKEEIRKWRNVTWCIGYRLRLYLKLDVFNSLVHHFRDYTVPTITHILVSIVTSSLAFAWYRLPAAGDPFSLGSRVIQAYLPASHSSGSQELSPSSYLTNSPANSVDSTTLWLKQQLSDQLANRFHDKWFDKTD